MEYFESGKEVSGEIIRILDKGIIILLERDVEGIIPFGKMSKKDRRNLASQYEVGANLSGIIMKVSAEDKKVILYKEELAGTVKRTSANDEVKQYLTNQSKDTGEKLELPQELIDLASKVESELPEKDKDDLDNNQGELRKSFRVYSILEREKKLQPIFRQKFVIPFGSLILALLLWLLVVSEKEYNLVLDLPWKLEI